MPAVEVEAPGPDGPVPVRVSNPDKVLFTVRGETKLDLVRYYLHVGEGVLRALRCRPTYLKRHPEGAASDPIYQKRVPPHPDFIETVQVAFPSGRTADALCPTSVAAVCWAANLATIDFHPWPSRRGDVEHPDELRIDLDPQPGTGFDEAREVAASAKEVLDELGYAGYPKTSGGRGLHIYVRIEPRWPFPVVRRCALALGRELERRRPDRVTTAWWKEERGAKLFVDYNQNARDRTIASAYSVRARPEATVSAPVSWAELADCDPADFTLATMPGRFARVGDRHAAIDDVVHSLEPLLDWVARDERDRGLGEAPYPPNFPKMPGEPMRVQPSRARTDQP